MRSDCLRLICEPHSLRFFSPPLVGAVGMFPERLREGVLLCVLVKWALSCERGVLAGVLTLCGWRARRFVFFLLVA